METVKTLLRGDNLSLLRKNKFGSPNFVSKTDLEKLSIAKKPDKGSADVVGFHIILSDCAIFHILPDEITNACQFTPEGVFTKDKDITKELVKTYHAILIEDKA